MRFLLLLAGLLMILYIIGAYLSGGTIGLVYFFAYFLSGILSMTVESAYNLFLVLYVIAAFVILLIGIFGGKRE